MSRLSIRARLARWRGKSTLRVKPRFRIPTYVAFEQVCLACGLDPDDVRGGKARFSDARIADLDNDGPFVLELVLENDGDFAIEAFERHVYEEFVAVVVAHFFLLALNTFEGQKEALRISLSVPGQTAYRTAPANGRRSVAFSRSSNQGTTSR